MPEPPPDFPAGQSLDLQRSEAEYLLDRIQTRVGGTLLAWFADRAQAVEGVEAPWEHPQAAQLPSDLAGPLEHARVFSELMHGALLVYNLLLSRQLENEAWIARYDGKLQSWADAVAADRRRIEAWDRRAFWELAYGLNPRIPAATRTFVDQWIDLALEDPLRVGD